jgi:predicted patatin/cPLA2 family phospholipase
MPQRETSDNGSDGAPLPHGVNPQAVIAAIKARADDRGVSGPRTDQRKLALVIEGGGMRAVHSAGGAVVLGQLGFTDLFDQVYATSAGAMNAAYLLAGQGEMGITIYYEDLAGKRFLNPLRLWKVLDVDYIFDHVVTVAKPLDVGRILAASPAFFVALTDATTGQGFLVDVKTTPAPVLDVLKAATAIPVLYNRTVCVEGRPCMDGGLPIPFPIEQAIANGCTDVLVLLTRPQTYICAKPGRGTMFAFNALCSRGNQGLYLSYARHNERETAARDLALGRSPVPPGVNIATICPDEPETVQRSSTDAGALYAAAVKYGRKTLRIFGADAEAWGLAPIRRG